MSQLDNKSLLKKLKNFYYPFYIKILYSDTKSSVLLPHSGMQIMNL